MIDGPELIGYAQEHFKKKKENDAYFLAKKRAEEAALDKKKQHAKELEAQRAQRESVINHITQRPEYPAHDQGVLGEMAHLNGLTAEGVAFKTVWILIFNLLERLADVDYRQQKFEFNQAKAQDAQNPDPNKHLAYQPNHLGILPKIYPIDAAGNVDYMAEPLQPKDITRRAIRANKFVPPPSRLEAFVKQNLQLSAKMNGFSSLSLEQRELLSGKISERKNELERNEADKARDLAAQRAAMAHAKSKP